MTVWSPEDVAEARRLWDEKKLSVREIAALFGYATRNAVIGLAHRRGWPSRVECRTPHYFGEREVTAHKPKLKVRSPMPRVSLAPVFKAEALPESMGRPNGATKPFMLTTAHECRWPVERTDAPAHAMMLVCGAGTVESRPYCEPHCRAAGSGYTNRRIKAPFESTVRTSVWA